MMTGAKDKVAGSGRVYRFRSNRHPWCGISTLVKEAIMLYVKTMLASILMVVAPPLAAVAAPLGLLQDAKIDVDIKPDGGGDVWYTSPTFLIVGAIVLVLLVALVVAAGRGGGGTTVV